MLYGVLGIITGVAAALFVHGLHAVEDLFERIHGRYLRHVFGMLLVGHSYVRAIRAFWPLLRGRRRVRDYSGNSARADRPPLG